MTPESCAPAPAPRPFVLVTGLSGAGRATILRVLEDLGFETVDNPPLSILEGLVEDGAAPLAAGIDTRTRGFAPDVALAVLDRLRADASLAVSLLFATAEDAVLQRRYTETRRRHPLAPGGPLGRRVQDGIGREKALLAPLQDAADWVVDTSDLPIFRLRQMIEARFRPEGPPSLSIQCQSFAFPRGLPREADLVFDLRFLQNPHYDDALRPLTGHDAAVQEFVAADPDFATFWRGLVGFLLPLLPRYVSEGKKYLTIALGCTGGRHRSVFLAEKLADHLRRQGWRAESAHREIDAVPHIPAPARDADPSPTAPEGQEAPHSPTMRPCPELPR